MVVLPSARASLIARGVKFVVRHQLRVSFVSFHCAGEGGCFICDVLVPVLVNVVGNAETTLSGIACCVALASLKCFASIHVFYVLVGWTVGRIFHISISICLHCSKPE